MKSMLTIVCGLLFFNSLFCWSNDPWQEVQNKILKEAKKKYQLELSGIGFEQTHKKITRIFFTFDFRTKKQNILYKKNFKQTLIAIRSMCTFIINQEQEIHSEMYKYPITEQSIGIEIFQMDPLGNDYFHPMIGIASLNNGYFRYHTYDPDNEFGYIIDEEEKELD